MTFHEAMLMVATFIGAAVGQWATRRTLRELLRAELVPYTARVDALWVEHVQRASARGVDHADA